MAISGCGGSPSPNPAVAYATAAQQVAIQSTGGVIAFPIAGGYGGTFVYSANSAAGPVVATITTSTQPVAIPPPEPPGTALASFTLTLSQTVAFSAWHSLLSTIELPAAVSTAGHSFSEWGYDVTSGIVGLGSNPGIVSGQSIAFGDGLGNVSLIGNHTYLVVLVMR